MMLVGGCIIHYDDGFDLNDSQLLVSIYRKLLLLLEEHYNLVKGFMDLGLSLYVYFTEPQNSCSWKSLWKVFSLMSYKKQGQKAAQNHFQYGFVYLQEWRLHHCSGLFIPMFDQPQF